MAKIIIGSDLCPTKYDEKVFISGDAHLLLNDIIDIFNSADLRIVNLECPLTDFNSPIVKSGPALRAPSKCINGIKAMNVDIAVLANNHILDQGESGVINTINLCKNIGIKTIGAGNNAEEAASWLFVNIDGQNIGW